MVCSDRATFIYYSPALACALTGKGVRDWVKKTFFWECPVMTHVIKHMTCVIFIYVSAEID
jgi:hypothetical protein